MRKGFSTKALTATGPVRAYAGSDLDQISFPLGGIGAGSVGLSGRGGLVDWAIFNRPNVGGRFARTFPIIWAQEADSAPVCRVLMAPAGAPYQGTGCGDPCSSGEGLPHMDDCVFRGEYPFAWIRFVSEALPVIVELEAYNPFIPGDPEHSGFPCAVLRYTLKNATRRRVRAAVAWSLLNMIGSIGSAAERGGAAEGDRDLGGAVEFGYGQNVNVEIEEKDLRGLLFTSHKWPQDHPRHGSVALLTPDQPVTILRHWLRNGWFTPMQNFWDTFSAKGRFPHREYEPTREGQTDAGALGIRAELGPGQAKTLTFYIAWHFPLFEKYWGEAECCASSEGGCPEGEPAPPRPTRAVWPNYYASRFRDALDVARKFNKNAERLYEETKRFHGALFSSSLPPHVIEAVSSQMAILKSATCLRLTDGTFYGFEGCHAGAGCCEGSCTHVWNYQQALAFLFPSLERSMRTADYRHNMREDGGMCFRLQLPLGSPPNTFHAAADGQLGGVIKTYRDWKICGDDAWLKRIWPHVKRALEYAWVQWDKNRDGVIDGLQHNTYDIEFRGANPLTASFYLAALEAGAAMAEHLGEHLRAADYRDLIEKGRAWVDRNLFNGEYYEQHHDPKEAPHHQFGVGCLSDQLLGQQLASLAGLGHVLDPAHVRKALRAVFRHNWRQDLREHANAQRVFALNDEAGLIVCTWPKGGRPAVPFPYCDEVWTGVEYQVASHLIWEGLVEEGLAIVKGARDRYDGRRRNPWDEFECGHHYARAMASYGLLLALAGFTFDKGAGRIGFEPRLHASGFRTFWALDGAWGTFEQKATRATFTVIYGAFRLKQLDLPIFFARHRKVKAVAGKAKMSLAIEEGGTVRWPKGLALHAGDSVTLSV